MATIIEMPKLSDTMTVGTLVNWLKKEGESVSNGDMIAEVETDKATMEVECFEDGILLKQYCKVGQEVEVGGAIAAIGETNEEPPHVESNTTKNSNDNDSNIEDNYSNQSEDVPSVEAIKINNENKFSANLVNDKALTENEHIKASPLARKIASTKGINLNDISGSGPNGRIVKADLENYSSKNDAPSKMSELKNKSSSLEGLEELKLPISNMRKSIANALVASKSQAPHFYLQIEVNGAPLTSMRKELNEKLSKLDPQNGGMKISVNDLTLKAAAEAVKRVPEINRSWEDSIIKQYSHIDLAFGVAIDDGLLTPVIRNAESKTLRQFSVEAKELINKARSKKLTPNEMSNSTLTVTNLGMFGISEFYGIINPKNAAILSIGSTIKRPIVNDKNEIVIGETLKIGLSGDHRVIDGAVGAKYLSALKEILETPTLMLI